MNATRDRSWLKALAVAGCSLAPLASTAWAVDTAHRGGTLRLVAHAAAGTLDPQVNYTLEYWQVFQSVYDGLLAFKKVPGAAGLTIVPDLAEAIPQPTDGGKTYVFALRKGVKFSNGKDVTTKDVVASFQRIFKVSSPTSGTFFAGIVGADACIKTAATCTLEGGVVGDEAAGTVTFHLKAPDAEFFDKLAFVHSSILPADAPAKDVGVEPIPGTGPYKIASYDPNKQLKMVRNDQYKTWSEDAQPDGYVDEIHYDFGLSEEDEVTQVANGQADWMFEQPPSDRLAEIGTKYKEQVHLSPLTGIYHLQMNTHLAPFDNPKARQAVQFGVDRKATVNLFGGANLGMASCQILPPGIPGYEPYCPYTKDPGAKWSAPDMEKAKQLVQESGTAGQEITLIVEDSSAQRAIGTYVQSFLNQLGYKASVKPLSSDIQFTYIQNTNNKVQISLAYWLQDYPTASDFLYILFSCDSYHPGSDSSINVTGYCDQGTEAMMKKALETGVTDPTAANAMWAAVDKKITDDGPDAVLFVPKHIDFVSKRVGNFSFNPQDFFMFSRAWVQ